MSPTLISGSGGDGFLDWKAGSGGGVVTLLLENVSTYKGFEPCKPTAPCCQAGAAGRRILSDSPVEPTGRRGPPSEAGEPVNHLSSRSNMPMLV